MKKLKYSPFKFSNVSSSSRHGAEEFEFICFNFPGTQKDCVLSNMLSHLCFPNTSQVPISAGCSQECPTHSSLGPNLDTFWLAVMNSTIQPQLPDSNNKSNINKKLMGMTIFKID